MTVSVFSVKKMYSSYKYIFKKSSRGTKGFLAKEIITEILVYFFTKRYRECVHTHMHANLQSGTMTYILFYNLHFPTIIC